MRATLACCLASLLSVIAPPTRAAPPLAESTPAERAPAELAPPEPAKPEHRVIWRYPKFRWWEYVAAGAVSVGNLSFEYLYQSQPNERFTGPILLDRRARSLFRAEAQEDRLLADDISDYMWHGSTYYVLLDGLVTPLAADRLNTEVALQLTLLNWQAIGLAGLLARLTHVTVGRRRPMLEGCSDEPDAPNPCRFEGASFIGGHAMMTSANAGLACANHINLPLYGGGIADDLVCPVMVTAALSVGTLRMVADKHWLSDTVPAWLLGGGIGFGLPWLLHYRYVRTLTSPLPGTALLPWADQTSGGLRFVGQL